MTKNSRLSFALAILILLAGAGMRLVHLIDVPPGVSADQVIDLRLAETVRQGNVRVFFDLNGEGREILYPAILATVTGIFGAGTVIYALLSVFLSMLTQALTFALGRRLYGDLAGLAALGFMALVWWPVLLGRMTGRETLLPLLTTMVLLTLALGLPVYGRVRTGTSQTVAFAGLGTALAFGIYLHPVGLVVMLMGLTFILYYMAFGRPRLTDQLRRTIGFTVLLTLIFIVPYLLSVGNMPHLSGAVRLVGALSGDGTSLLQRVNDAVMGLGVRGDMNPNFNIPGRPFADPLTAVLIIVGGLVALRYSRRRLRYMMLSLAMIVLVPLGLLATNSPSWQASAVLLPLLALCFGLGISSVARMVRSGRVAGALLVVLLIVNGIWTAHDMFTVWPELDEVRSAYNTRVASLAQHVDHTASDLPTMICSADVIRQQTTSGFTNSRLLSLLLNNRGAHLRYVDCSTAMIFPNGGESMQVIIPTTRVLSVSSPAVLQWLNRGIADTRGVIRLDVVQPLADRTGLFTTRAPVRLDPEAAPGAALVLPPVRLENNLTFLGYEELVPTIEPGGILPVVTYWRVDGLLPPDLVLFAHLYDDVGAAPLANQDSISVVPAQLEQRDVFVQVHFIQLPQTLPERAYTIAVGAYRGQSAERLRVLPDSGGVPIGSRLILYDVEVMSNP